MFPHFSHPHPLEEGYAVADAEHCCHGCKKPISEMYYACHSCGYYLHETCAKLQRKIQHFFHPCTLLLQLASIEIMCDACFEECSNMFVYTCADCDFYMHVECAILQPTLPEEGHQHFSHHHALEQSHVDANADHHCNVCMKPISELSYLCHPCGFYLHKSCAELPRHIEHYFHPHPCTLRRLTYETTCDACTEDCSYMFVYNCAECEFDMHVACAVFRPIRSKDLHWSHLLHPLQPVRELRLASDRIFHCAICGRGTSVENDYAVCEECSFRVHESCLDRPRDLKHRCHPHPLLLRAPRKFECNTCLAEKYCSTYECKKCDFNMDVECASCSQEIAQGNEVEHIRNSCHHHPLWLLKDPKIDNEDIVHECLVCRSSVSGLTYGCKQCNIYVHQPCLNILTPTITVGDGTLILMRRSSPITCNYCGSNTQGFRFQEVKSKKKTRCSWCVTCALLSLPSVVTNLQYFHPCPLTLKLFPAIICNCCFTNCHKYAYHCDLCDFYVGIQCVVQISMERFKSEEQGLRCFCHWHPLQYIQDMEVPIAPCNICRGLHLESFYFCKECNFCIHKSCLDILPQKIDKHYFNCTLVLLTTLSYRCVTCQRENNSGLTFWSIEKRFKLCIECVLWPKNGLNKDNTFTSIHHWHRLTLIDNLEQDVSCLLCRRKCSTSVYYCRQCEDYFHETCAELPFEMEHLIHPGHLLTLIHSSLELQDSRRRCTLCHGDLLVIIDDHHSGVYSCKECNFQLDKKCATSIPSIQYQDHPHLLIVVEDMHGEDICQVCSDHCPRKEDLISQKKESRNALRCARCKFTLHLTCGPLPFKIKHPCHIHELLLADFSVEENYTDKFVCHVCEAWRDPRLPVYLCEEGCPMICEIRCVISEVMPKLLGDHGDVELKTTYPFVASKVISKDEALKTITNFSRTSKRRITRDWANKVLNYRNEEDEDEDESMFKFCKDAFDHFSSKLNLFRPTLERDEVSHLFPQHDIDELRDWLSVEAREFFGEYDILGQTSDRLTSIILCIVMHDMHMTKMVDVTCQRVRKWLDLLRLVKDAGFDISFVHDKIHQAWKSHFLIKAKAIVDDTSLILERKLKQLSEKEEDLLNQLKATREEMKKIKEQQENHVEYVKDGMKDLKKDHAKVLLIKWKPTSSFLNLGQSKVSNGSRGIKELFTKMRPKFGDGDAWHEWSKKKRHELIKRMHVLRMSERAIRCLKDL